jgi:hypothetical protein
MDDSLLPGLTTSSVERHAALLQARPRVHISLREIAWVAKAPAKIYAGETD